MKRTEEPHVGFCRAAGDSGGWHVRTGGSVTLCDKQAIKGTTHKDKPKRGNVCQECVTRFNDGNGKILPMMTAAFSALHANTPAEILSLGLNSDGINKVSRARLTAMTGLFKKYQDEGLPYGRTDAGFRRWLTERRGEEPKKHHEPDMNIPGTSRHGGGDNA